jgi:hypothetical protein
MTGYPWKKSNRFNEIKIFREPGRKPEIVAENGWTQTLKISLHDLLGHRQLDFEEFSADTFGLPLRIPGSDPLLEDSD